MPRKTRLRLAFERRYEIYHGKLQGHGIVS